VKQSHLRQNSNGDPTHPPRQGGGKLLCSTRGAGCPHDRKLYELQDIDELAQHRIGDFLQIRYAGTNDAKRVLGSITEIRGAFIDIQKHLFS
jgi:hypothetical protein